VLQEESIINRFKGNFKVIFTTCDFISSCLKIFHIQLKHDLAFLVRNGNKSSLFEAFLNEVRILMSSDAPKGFDKFFKPPKSTESSQKQTDEKSSEKPDESSSKPSASKPSSSSAKSTNKSPPDWNLGMFSPTPSSKGSQNQGQGRPIPPGNDQNPDQNKMIFYAAMGFVALIGALMYFELGYKEISWKDFINK
jgi:hypothetical protein